jgi:hypothetical protein
MCPHTALYFASISVESAVPEYTFSQYNWLLAANRINLIREFPPVVVNEIPKIFCHATTLAVPAEAPSLTRYHAQSVNPVPGEEEVPIMLYKFHPSPRVSLNDFPVPAV